MPFPFVAVTLPDNTPPAYVAGLLSACSQAYPEGSCQSDPDSSPPTATSGKPVPENSGEGSAGPRESAPGEKPDPSASSAQSSVIVANVTWTNTETATILLGLPHWRNHRWIERLVPFKEQDQPLERYRALGFTIGSLAVTVSEVAKLEQEAREPESKPEPSANEDTPKSVAAEGNTTAVSEPSKSPAMVDDPPDGVDIPIISSDGERSRVFVRGYLAGELGEGFDSLRRGGSIGIGLFGSSWGGRVSGYYTDASGNGLDATFAGVEVSADIRIELPAVEANICVGGGFGHLNARVSKEASQVYPSGVVSINLMPARWTFAPYLGFGVRLFRGFETDVPNLDPLGPITPFLQLGLAASSQGESPSK